MADKVLIDNELHNFFSANFIPRTQITNTSVKDFERLQSSTAAALFYFFSNQYEKITNDQVHDLNAVYLASQKNIDNILRPALVLSSIGAIHSESLNVDKEKLRKLITDCKSERFAINLIAAAIADSLSLASPFSDNTAYCNESYEVNSEMTCLRFTDGRHCFFLIQYVSSADGLYFPDDNILISLAHLKQIHVNRLYKKLFSQFPEIIEYAKSTNRFHGAIASHKRPSHFYYDIWPVLFELNNEEALYQKIPHLFMRAGEDYYNLDFLYDHPSHNVTSDQGIDRIAFEHNKLFISIGTNRHLRKSNFCFESADRFLVDKALNFPTSIAVEKTNQVKNCYPLVWIGVEGQKRCWLEQIEGYAYILNQLAKRYPQLGVVIDGWTVPFSPSSKDIKEADKDRRLAEQIVARLNPDIPYIFTMGENSHTKIFVGNNIDFFITNFATGSMHVSRILGKPGFCHLSGELSQSSLQHHIQIHPNNKVYLLPQKFVKDRPDVGNSFIDSLKKNLFKPIISLKDKQTQITKDIYDIGSLSYSIDKKEFYKFIEQRLDQVLNKTDDVKFKFFLEPYLSIPWVVIRYLRMASYNKIITVYASLPPQKNIVDLARFSDNYLKNYVIYGMYYFGAHTKLNKPGDYLVWLKEPFQRVQDHVRYIANEAEKKRKPTDIYSILKTQNHKGLDNHYTRILSGIDAPFGHCTEEMLNLAIANLRQYFVFVGIVEQLAQSFDRLCTVMDWDRSLFPDELPNDPLQEEVNDFSEDEKLLVINLIQFDLRLYSEALKIVSDDLAQNKI